jgi:hypothetical protein
MKRVLSIFAIAAGLSACGVLPISFALDPASYSFGASQPAVGTVVYPAAASGFSQAPVNVASVVVRGQAAIDSLGTPSVTGAIYGRVSDPATDPKCTVYPTFVSCPAASETKLSGDLTLTSAKSGFEIGGDTLKQAVNSGKIWLGLELKSGFSANLTLKLTDMIATVTLF